MEENVDLKVVVQVTEAEKNLEKLNGTLDETKKKVDNINDSVDEGVPSVGGLDKAFESVFNTVSKEGSKGGAVIKKIFDSVKNAIPTVKALNNTAITGLKGIKGAIAATGLGILVVLLGELISHWDQFSAAIQKWIPFMREGHEETEKLTQANEDLLTANKEQNEEINFQARLMKALGAEEKDVIAYKIKETQALQANTQAQIKETEAKIASMKAHSAFRRWITGENKDIEKLEESLKTLTAENDRLTKSIKGFNQDIQIEEAKAQTERTENAKKGSSDRVKNEAEEAKKRLEEIRKNSKDVMETMKAIAKGLYPDVSKESVEYFKNLLNPESARAAADEVLEELKKAGVEINQAVISGLLEGDYQEASNKINEMISDNQSRLARGFVSTSEALKREAEVEQEVFNREEKLLTKRMGYIKKYSSEASDEYKDLESQLVVLADERIAKAREYERKVAEAALDEELNILEANLEKLRDEGDRAAGLEGGLLGRGMADIYKQEQEALSKYYATMRDSYDVGTAEYEAYAQKYEEITERLNGFDGKRTQFVFQEINKQYKYWNDLVSSIGSLFGSLADIYEEDIKAKQERGEISEEEAKKEFENVKKLQLAEVWINTLSGAIGAFLQASAAYPAPWGQILGAATAATVLASGIAQHAKIKNTKYGDTGGSSGEVGVSVPNVGVTPIDVRDDIQVSPSALAQSQSPVDQRVYILEGDIQDSNKRVEIREANSTF